MDKVKKNNSYKIFHDQKNNYGKKEFQSIDLKNKTISMNDHMINLNDYSLAKKFGNCYFWIKND